MALAALLLILFPVISVTDDFWAVHNPAETDRGVCRDHSSACEHTVAPDMGFGPNPGAAPVTELVLGRLPAGESGPPTLLNPPPSAFFIRPPPMA